jgi:uncharacterized repeat protein (TIGR03806 family)
MRIHLALLLVLGCSGCKKGDGVVVVTVDARPPLAGVHGLHVTATIGEQVRDYDIALPGAPVALPPVRTFAIVASQDLGDRMIVKVQAQDENQNPIGPFAEGEAEIVGGSERTLDLVIGVSVLDGGMPDLTKPIVSPHGIDSRPANPTCVAPMRPPSNAQIQIVRMYMGAPLSTPIDAHQPPGDPSTWYVAEKGGIIKKFPNMNNVTAGQVVTTLDITARTNATHGESGLLSFAFHPQFATNKKLYVSYTANGPYPGVNNDGTNLRSTVSWFPEVAGDLDETQETLILPSNDNGNATTPGEMDQPYNNHNGGYIAFGHDGMLYVGTGDGGSGGDPGNRAQNNTSLFGKMLRVDVNTIPGGQRYGIPPSNPFAGGGGRPEIYATGLRNPWRWSFDRGNGDLWLGDVGQNIYEEIDVIKLGGNYGWRQREAAHCFNPGSGCQTAGMVDPIVEYSHANGRASIVGGFVYRGSAIPALVGSYLFGDTYSGEIFTVRYDAMNQPMLAVLLDTPQLIYSFAEDAEGEVYIVSANNNGLYKIQPMGTPVADTFPKTLSATGCVDPTDATKPAAGLIPYAVSAPLWSDGADKKRWMAVPDGQKIKLTTDGDFDFPNGSVLVKEFSLNQKRVETRLFMRHSDGGWAGYTYEWNATGTDANLLPAGKTATVGTQTWTFPSRNECVSCHTQVAGGTLGLEIQQLNYEVIYEATNRMSNQIATLDHIGMFETSPGDPATLPLLPAYDSMAPLQQRAKAYLHSNCSNCHRPMGTGRGPQDFRFATAVGMSMLCNVDPQEGALGIAGAKLIAPGDPSKSIVSVRMRALNANRMPPLATRVVDATGAKLIDDWIMSLTSCP